GTRRGRFRPVAALCRLARRRGRRAIGVRAAVRGTAGPTGTRLGVGLVVAVCEPADPAGPRHTAAAVLGGPALAAGGGGPLARGGSSAAGAARPAGLLRGPDAVRAGAEPVVVGTGTGWRL